MGGTERHMGMHFGCLCYSWYRLSTGTFDLEELHPCCFYFQKSLMIQSTIYHKFPTAGEFSTFYCASLGSTMSSLSTTKMPACGLAFLPCSLALLVSPHVRLVHAQLKVGTIHRWYYTSHRLDNLWQPFDNFGHSTYDQRTKLKPHDQISHEMVYILFRQCGRKQQALQNNSSGRDNYLRCPDHMVCGKGCAICPCLWLV